MTRFDKKRKAHNFRRKGFSINTIAERLKISKSTASIWCKNILLSLDQKQVLLEKSALAALEGRLKGAYVNKQKKLKKIEFYKNKGITEIGKLSRRDFFIAGIALYWGEGSKKDEKFSIVNSDPALIFFMFRWFQELFKIPKTDFMPRIFINSIHAYRIDQVLKFWSSLLELPIEQFKKPTFLYIKSKKVYTNHKDYYGVLALRVKSPSLHRYRMLGLIGAMKKV